MTQDDGLLDSTAGEIATVFTGGVGSALAGRLFGVVRKEVERARSVAIAAAEDVTGLKREDIAEKIADDPRLVPLVARTLYAIGMTNQDEILAALGAALGDAVSNPTRIDEVELIVIGLQDLRRTHISLLRTLAGEPRWLSRTDRPPYDDMQPVAVTALGEAERWNVEAIAEVSGLDDDEIAVLVTALANAGFVRALGVYGGTGYQVTSQGRTLLAVLETYDARRRNR